MCIVNFIKEIKMNSIQVKQEFNAPIDQVFDLLSKRKPFAFMVSLYEY